MKRTKCILTIGDYTFTDCVAVHVESSWDTFTDTATIEIRNKFRYLNQTVIAGDSNIFKRNDPVEIRVGYHPSPGSADTPLFKGYISDVNPDKTITIKCEDEAYKLKQINLESHSWQAVTVQQLCDYYIKGVVDYDVIEADLGGFEVDNKSFMNFIEVLEVLKSPTYRLYSWFENGVLKIQTPVLSRENQTTHYFIFDGKDCNVIDSSLTYSRSDDYDLVLKAESIMPDNSRVVRYATRRLEKVIITTEEQQGGQRYIPLYNYTQEQVDDLLTRTLETFKIIALDGTFTTHGKTIVRHGDLVDLCDNRYPERGGVYIVKQVDYDFGLNGFRQTITPDKRIS